MEYKLKNILQIILISFVSFTIIACAKESGSSSSSTTTATMSTASIADGNYKLTAAVASVYYSNGTLEGTYTYSISHDSSVTPGYLALVMEWKGSGIYRITSKGKATLSASGSDDVTIDCTTNAIDEFTLDTDGNKITEIAIQAGCEGSSSSLSEVSQKFTVISGGFQHYGVFEDSDSNQYQMTYTFQKQDATTTTELEGTWKSSCVSAGSSAYLLKTLTVSGTDVTYKWDYHNDSSCNNDDYRYYYTFSSLSIGNAITFDSGKTGHKITTTIDTNTYTPLSSSDVTWDNTNSWCGETDWVLNTAQSIAGKTCDSTTHWNLNIAIYGVYALVDGSKLFLGLATDSYPPTLNTSDNETLTKQ